jgi:hypothetical protein
VKGRFGRRKDRVQKSAGMRRTSVYADSEAVTSFRPLAGTGANMRDLVILCHRDVTEKWTA